MTKDWYKLAAGTEVGYWKYSYSAISATRTPFGNIERDTGDCPEYKLSVLVNTFQLN
jgi:hypothetical protein